MALTERHAGQAGSQLPRPCRPASELDSAQRDLIGKLRTSWAVSPGEEKAGGAFECRRQDDRKVKGNELALHP